MIYSVVPFYCSGCGVKVDYHKMEFFNILFFIGDTDALPSLCSHYSAIVKVIFEHFFIKNYDLFM